MEICMVFLSAVPNLESVHMKRGRVAAPNRHRLMAHEGVTRIRSCDGRIEGIDLFA